MLLALLMAIVPTTWLRSEVGDRYSAQVTVTSLQHPARTSGAFSVQGLWQLRALSENFGGYSALAVLGTRIRLFSDKGWLLTVPRPDQPAGDLVVGVRQLYPTGVPIADLLDIESVTYNPSGGQYWVGYESHHTIYRYSMTGEPEHFVQPAYTANWGHNSGIEAMVRLDDGRFVVLKETGGIGFLYRADPVDGAEPMPFRIAWPDGYEPVDMAQLPDGRVLILLRRLGWHLPVFESRLVVADPALIDPDKVWRVTPLLQLEKLLPRDNYEGLAVEPGTDGSVTLWLASDDNRSALQRSLLAKLRWVPESVEPQ